MTETPAEQSHKSLYRMRLDAFLGLRMPQGVAQTVFDHEEYARFYLSLLTDEEYMYLRGDNSPYLRQPNPNLWSDAELIRKARQHAEAAKILRELENLHDDES